VENAVIKKVGGKFQLWTSDGKRPLGKVGSKSSALAQERAIKARQAAAAKGRR
jgi:hypothetical protein